MNPIAAGVVALVALVRLVELWYARRNTRALLDAGGVEVGGSHYPLIVALHAAWLVAILLTVPPGAAVSVPLLILFGFLQGLRAWVLLSLGRYWTTRVITLPGAPLVRRGPYRFLRHPNYLVVAAEIAVLPLAFGAWGVAIAFSALNGALLVWRISVEDRALAPRREASQIIA
ncbi:MAG TPA: isoprenylcysteine carboxylmethyltransferase family protein [Stellaceae bacterium]|nr:isoprenylcysteine carboxylmethyltransferase family protein [Stellaceae bacterium]